MKTKKKIKFVAVGSFLLTLSAGFLINFNLEKHRSYKPGQYLPEKDAYFAGEIDDKGGHIKAHKFVVPADNKYSSQLTRSMSSEFIGNIESVWDTYTGKGTKIAIIDDGFDVDHPEYRRSNNTSAILPESRYYFIDDNGTEDEDDDFVNYQQYSSNPSCIKEEWESKEWASHGTATSTTAAAPMNNNGGVGIAPDADILALKIDFSFASIYYAIQYAVAQGVDVINMSLGAYSETFIDGCGDQQTGSSAVATYLNSVCQQAYNAGIIVVAAAGNEATWHKSYPACNYKVVGVGAIGDWDNKGNATELAEFTNYVKSNETGEINVDILAPGYVYTAHQKGTQSSPTHTYADTQGTSFSSPIVAGAACLWKEKYPNGTPDQFLSQLQSTADGIGSYKNKMIPVSGWYSELPDVGPSNIENGRLNVAKLLGIDDPYVKPTQSSFNISVGEKRQIGIESSVGTLSYLTSNANVATVSSSGLIEGKGVGNATITVRATKDNKTYDATIPVDVTGQIACESIAFNPKSISLNVGNTYDAEAIITTVPSNATRSFAFASDDESVATVVYETGLITAVGEGTTTISAISEFGDGYDELTVTVNKAAAVETGNITFGSGTDDLTVNSSSVSGDDSLGNTWIVNTSGTTSFTQNADYSQIGSSKSPAGSISFSMTLSSSVTFTSVTASFGGFSGTTGNVTIKVGETSIGSGSLSGTSDVNVGNTSEASGTTLTVLISNISKGVKAYSITYSYSSGSTPIPPTPSKTLSSISIEGQQTEFTVGDDFVFGGTVTAHYSDSTTADVTSSATFSGYNMDTAGDYTVTVSYTEGVTKTAEYIITVASGGSGEQGEYSGTFNRSNVGTTWTLTDYSDMGSYLRCPESGSSSTALIEDIFDGKEITSDVVITLHIATYGGGTNPSATTFKIYNSSACTTQVTATQTGTLPSSSTFTDAIYTVSQANAAASFTDDLAILITKPGKQIRLESITVEFTYETPTPKVINSLVASYTGGSLYVGQSLDTSKLTVTAKYTNSDKYHDAVLPSSDYQLSGFDSSSAGNKTVTVTYNGALETSTSPLTTTFNVTVLADTITSVTASVSKSYHPGEIIAKGDITLTVTYQSSRVEHPTDFTFANDGYQFTYADAASGGTATKKTFTNAIAYSTSHCSLEVYVSRNAYEEVSNVSDTLTRATTGVTSGSSSYTNWSGKQCTSGAVYAGCSAGGNGSIQLRTKYSESGIVTTVSGGKVKSITVSWNTNTLNSRSINIYGKNSAYESASDLFTSNQGTLLGTLSYGNTTLVVTGSYTYIGIRSSADAIYLDSVTISYGGDENATNVANYIMFEDTENQCVSKLDTAITYFENMSKEERTLFMTSEDYVIVTARERLEAWLANQEKNITPAYGDYVISNNKTSMSYFSEEDNGITIVLVVSSFLSISILGCLLMLKKRKRI